MSDLTLKNQAAARIILFQKLTGTGLPLAWFFQRLGFRIYYLNLSKSLEKHYFKLKRQSILVLNREEIDQIVYKYMEQLDQTTKQIAAQFVFSSSFYNSFLSLFSKKSSHHSKNLKIKFNACFEKHISERIRDFIILRIFAFDFLEKNNKCTVFLWAEKNAFTQFILENDLRKYTNLKPIFFTHLEDGFYFFKKTLLKAINSLAFKKVKSVEKKQHPPSGKNVPTTEEEIVFFPHLGVFYSHLYIKDHYYNKNPSNPFHKSKILHLSLNDPPDLIQDSIEYYYKNSIPHLDLYKLRTGKTVGLLFSYAFFIVKNWKISLKEFRITGLYGFRFYLEFFKELFFFLSCLERLKKAKIALVGYDINFPALLSLALELRGIKTIATQERFLSTWFKPYAPILNYYFTIGRLSQQTLQSNRRIGIDQIIPLGLPRLDHYYKAFQEPKNHKYFHLKKNYFLLLAVDTHSASTELKNRTSFANWKTNQAFYQDMIALSQRYPNLYIIIKGKNDDFTRIPEFKDIVDKINCSKNITIETDYVNYPPARMVELCDAAVCMYSSLFDELLMSNKEAILWDRFNIHLPFFDFERLPAIANNFTQLCGYIETLLERRPLISVESKTRLLDFFYQNPFDGKVRGRLSDYLEKIYVDSKKTRNTGHSEESFSST